MVCAGPVDTRAFDVRAAERLNFGPNGLSVTSGFILPGQIYQDTINARSVSRGLSTS
jgi:hypothetical protein